MFLLSKNALESVEGSKKHLLGCNLSVESFPSLSASVNICVEIGRVVSNLPTNPDKGRAATFPPPSAEGVRV
jgi:hypothetical protein